MFILNQLKVFVASIVVGVVVGAVFDFYRAWRLVVRPNKIWGLLSDLGFWLFMTVFAFLVLFHSNWLELRFYMLLGIMAGALLDLGFISRFAVPFWRIVWRTFIKVLGFPLRLIKKPRPPNP